MLNATQIVIAQLAQLGFNSVLLVKDEEAFLYENGEKTNKAYRRATVLNPDDLSISFTIKVMQTTPLVTPEELKAKKSIAIVPVGFEGKFYKDQRTGDTVLTASAKGIKMAKDGAK